MNNSKGIILWVLVQIIVFILTVGIPITRICTAYDLNALTGRYMIPWLIIIALHRPIAGFCSGLTKQIIDR